MSSPTPHPLPPNTQSVPADLSCLGGIAVIDEASATLQYLPLDSLPADPAGRFGALFAMRPRCGLCPMGTQLAWEM